MSEAKALLRAIARDPGLLGRVLPNLSAGLPPAILIEVEARTRAYASALSSVVQQFAAPTPSAGRRATTVRKYADRANTTSQQAGARGGQAVGMTALVSLVAVTGALSVLGTVSLVALAGEADKSGSTHASR